MNHSSDPPLYFRRFVGVPLVVNTHPSFRMAFFSAFVIRIKMRSKESKVCRYQLDRHIKATQTMLLWKAMNNKNAKKSPKFKHKV